MSKADRELSGNFAANRGKLPMPVQKKLDELPKERMVFEQEFFPEDMLLAENLPYTVEQDPEDEHRYLLDRKETIVRLYCLQVLHEKQ